MSTGIDEAAGSSSSSARPEDVTVPAFAGDQTSSSIHLRNGVTSPGSPGSEADSTINDTSFAPSILASRLGRGIYSSTGAAGSTLSLSGSGFNSPTLALTGFNAISTVLNNPSKRQHPINPKSSRFPAVNPNHVPAEIPKVKKAELDSYLSSVRPEWDRFMRNQSMGRQGKATIEQQQQQQQQQQQKQRSSNQDSSHESEPFGQQGARHRSRTSIANLSVDLQAVPPPQPRKRLPNLSAVPQVFFSEDFDLGNPYTFDQVTERYKVASSSPAEQNGGATPTYDVALNQMLQEKLSYYSDVIEQHLIIEIGQQSSSFFAALENLNDLNAEAESCLLKIDQLKSELESIDEKQAKKGLQVIRQQQHRRQLERRRVAVRDVRQVIERRDLVRLLLQQGETEEALDLLDKLRTTLHRSEGGQSPNPTGNHSTANAANATDRAVALSELRSLASIPAQLEEMEQTLSGMLEQDLITALKMDIDERLSTFKQRDSSASADKNSPFNQVGTASGTSSLSAGAETVESPLTPSKPPASPFGHSASVLSPSDSELASRIAPLVVGLAKTGGIEKAVAAYREVAIQAIQEAWKESLSQDSAEMAESAKWLLAEDLSKLDGHDNLPSPAARLRDLEHAQFLDMCRQLFDTLMECLKAIDAQCKLVPRILDEYAARHSTAEKNIVESERKADSSVCGRWRPVCPPSSADNAFRRSNQHPCQVVGCRGRFHRTGPQPLCSFALSPCHDTRGPRVASFLDHLPAVLGFVLSSEQLCRKMIVGLRGTVLGQAKGFLANFHRRRIERAAKAVEEEMWAQADVGAEIQDQIRHIVSSAVEDPASFVITGAATPVAKDSVKQAETAGEADVAEDAGPVAAKTLDIEGRPYFVVEASLEVLALLVDYLKVIINLPLLTTEAMARVVEFLKQFNSRTCQVVLGAGAMRSAGLKNITAKHLALASQSLSVMISLIPYIRETVRRHLPPKQVVMLTEFDKLRRDFQEHQYEIHAKLVAIMSDRLTVHCRTLSSIDWNADKPASDGQDDDQSKELEPNKYAIDLVKETATLHKVLSKYLQGVVVEHVIGQVLRSIDDRIAQEFDKVEVKTQLALDRMQADVRYLGSKLSVLKHVEWKDETLQQVLASKHVAPPPTVSTTATTASSAANNEVAPGSPAIDKPGASPFGPVTYKPRIPNIFARRQQQQQQSQSGSPRASTDVTGSSTPMESQRSVDSTPRTSLQIQRQLSQSTNASSAAPLTEAQEAPGLTSELPPKSSTSTARSLEDEANATADAPPAPPSKGDDDQSRAVVKDQDADVEEADDLVAPVVPAPEAVAKVLGETRRASFDVPVAGIDAGDAPAKSAETGATTEPILPEESRDGQDGKATTLERHDQDNAKSPESTAPAETVKAAKETEDRSSAQAEEAASAVSAAPAIAEERPVQTPQKDQRGFHASVTQSSVSGTPGEASPVRSGASTPAAPATPKTPTGTTPSRPGRMSLKERLAEAARKRAQQSAPFDRTSSQPQPSTPIAAEPSAKEQKSEVKNETAAPAADTQGSTVQTTAVPRKTAVSDAVDSTVAEDKEATSEKPVSEPVATVQTDEATASEAASSTTVAVEATASSDAKVPEEASKDEAKNVVAEQQSTDNAATAATTAPQTTDSYADTVTPPAAPSTTNGTDAPSDPPAVVAATVDTNGDQDGEGDDADDGGDADADADANEGTNDSAVGAGPGAGSKKNKKKKKKGKKK